MNYAQDQPGCRLDDPTHPLVKDAPRHCCRCGQPLCLRKQVINLALGNTDEMLCLLCLASENDQTPAALLDKLMPYIHQRECFNREWVRYADVDFCPDRHGCLPNICFPIPRAPQALLMSESESHRLDLRGVACPMNFVKTKLLLDKLSAGEKVNVLLDDGEPVESVSVSIQQEGHAVLECELQTGGHYRLLIQKAGPKSPRAL